MALTDEQRARFNAKSAQKKTQGTVQNNNSDASDYQEFLRFKEMKRQQELQKQAAERQAAMQQQAIFQQQQEELRRQQEEIQRQRFELEQEKQAQQQQYQQSQQVPPQNNVSQPQQVVNQHVDKNGLTLSQQAKGWLIFFAVICVVYFIINSGSIFKSKTNTTTNQQQTTVTEKAQTNQQSSTNNQTETPSQSNVVNEPVKGTYYSVGDTVVIDGLQITLLDAGFVDPNTMWGGSADEGHGYYYLEFEGVNTSDKDMNVSLANFEAYCDDYSVDVSIISGTLFDGKSAFSGDIAVGKKIRGIVAFEVPLDFLKLEVRVVQNYWSSNYAEFVVFN